jgi:hypothetical protein
MHILLYILAIIGAILALAFIGALFIKKEYTVLRSITINKPRTEVFNYVRLLDNQVYYSKWVMADPNLQRTSKGVDGTVGFYSKWTSNNKQVGSGEQGITKIMEGERMEVRIHFIKPFDGMATAFWTTESITEDQTKVQWGLNGSSKYPMTLMNLVMDKMLGVDMEISLHNLKKILEQ